MTLEFVLELECIAGSSIELDAGISSDSQCLPVSGERMVGDRVMKEVMNFRAGHVV